MRGTRGSWWHGNRYQWNREHRDKGWNKGNRDEWRGVGDVMEIQRTWGWKRYSGGRQSGTDLLEIHWWSISNTMFVSPTKLIIKVMLVRDLNDTVLDINYRWISDKSVPLCLCYTFSIPKSVPFPSHLWHPSVCPCSLVSILCPYVACFIDICSHVTMILLSLTYSLLTPFLSFLVSC